MPSTSHSRHLERAKGFEPSTPTLARLCSTTELHPHPDVATTVIDRRSRLYDSSEREMQLPLREVLILFDLAPVPFAPYSGKSSSNTKLNRMQNDPNRLFDYLKALHIHSKSIEHPAVFTVEESKALRGKIDGAHVKNLFLKDKKSNLFLISALEDTKIDLKTIHDVIGGQGRVSFCSADQLREHLGVEPGSVTPFSVLNDTENRVKAILDERLMAYDIINVHPLVNTMTTSIARGDLVTFMTETGHKPLIIKVGEASTADD